MSDGGRAPGERPIGWWLKHVDNALENGLDAAIASVGLNRRRWQALNAIKDGANDRGKLEHVLAPFLDTGGGTSVEDLMASLLERGWVKEGADDVMSVTDDGRQLLEKAGAVVSAFRHRVTSGVSGDDYTTTVETLRRMAANLAEAGKNATPDTP